MKVKDLLIKDGNKYFKVTPDSILYVEADNRNCILHTEERNWFIRRSLGQFLADLNMDNLIRAHRLFAVNWKYVTGIGKQEIYLGHHIIPVGVTFEQNLMEKYLNE